MMFGLFRTEPDAPKHAGISYLLVPMDTPGVDARPLTMMQGLALDLIPEAGLREPDRSEVAMGIVDQTPGRWVSQYMFSLAFTIAGGTSNVQRNIIGERVLGLPRDQRPAA
jgi:alkylation response protein AidB-like acyl-CoA dehydrogenase